MITGESWQQIRLTNSSLTINIGSFYALSVIGESIIFLILMRIIMTVASKWWEACFGNKQDGLDYTGRQIKKSAYRQRGSAYGWVLEYILPLNNGGSDTQDNIHIVSCEANALRHDRLTYTIDGIRYQVQRNNGINRYSICKIGDKKMSIWEKEFGDVQEAYDFVGRKILKCAFGQQGSEYGWDIDHIQPLSKGGTDTEDNIQIVHILTNDEKSDKTTFISDFDGQTYQVQKTSKNSLEYWANGYDYSNKKYCMVIIDN